MDHLRQRCCHGISSGDLGDPSPTPSWLMLTTSALPISQNSIARCGKNGYTTNKGNCATGPNLASVHRPSFFADCVLRPVPTPVCVQEGAWRSEGSRGSGPG